MASRIYKKRTVFFYVIRKLIVVVIYVYNKDSYNFINE